MLSDILLGPEMLADGALLGERRSLGVVDLDRTPADLPAFSLPPWPVIGIGDAAHPLAGMLDAVAEAPVPVEALAASIIAHPVAAAIAVQSLRAIKDQPIETALLTESLAYGVLQGGTEHGHWLARRPATPGGLPEGKVVLRREGERLDIVMDRACARNAVDRLMRDALREAFLIAALDPDVRRVRFLGRGKAFSIGADLDEFGTTRDPAEAHAIRMATLPAPVIARCADRMEAHVQGACIGAGLEMAAFASRLTASPGAWFQLPELAMGLIPGAGGCVSLSRRIGRQRAALMILSGRRIGLRTALDWGLVDAVVSKDAADDGGADIPV